VRHVLRRLPVWVLVAAVFRVAPLNSQAPTSNPGKITFEVASVKLNTVNGGPQSIQLLPSGLLTVRGLPLRQLIQIAYGSEAIQTPGQLVGGPSWLATDRFDISAKAEGGVADEQGRPTRIIAMLRSLLEDRCQVKVHTESRDVPIYALVLANREAKFGTLFKPSTANCYSRESPPPPPGTPPDPARMCGIRGGNGNVTYVSVTMHPDCEQPGELPSGGPSRDGSHGTARQVRPPHGICTRVHRLAEPRWVPGRESRR
jgi:uncharacterized protein (TIGR03435 family)